MGRSTQSADVAPARSGPSGRRLPPAREAALVIGLVVLAVAVRLPYLWDIPIFTDETDEVWLGLRVARGQALPLTNAATYIGPLWNYLLAAVFLVGGPSLYSPRAVALALGALTVVPTYLFGRSLAGRAVGLLAATMLALSPAHIVVNSHIAWSNSITPLFSTTGLWLLHRAVRADRPAGLPLSGVAFGLALQTHPTAGLLLPGLALFLLRTRPTWLRSRWPYLAVGLAILVWGSVLANDIQGLGAARTVQNQYGRRAVASPAEYGQRLAAELGLLADSLGGALSETDPPVGPLGNPIVAWASLVAVAGLVSAARRGDSLPVLAIASVVLLMPLVNHHSGTTVNLARYFAPLLPAVYALMARLLVDVIGAAARLAEGRGGQARPARAAVAIGILTTIGAPLLGLQQYYQRSADVGRTNAPLLQAVAAVQAARRPGEAVDLDGDISSPYKLAGGRTLHNLVFASTVLGWPGQTIDLRQANTARGPAGPALLVIDPADELLAMQAYRLEPIAAPPLAPRLEVFRSEGPRPPPQAEARLAATGGPPRGELFLAGVSTPLGLAFAPDGRLFFAEAFAGRVRVVDDGGLRPEPFFAVAVRRDREQGALGLALDPDFAANHWVYVFYSEAEAEDHPARNRLVRFTEREGRAAEPIPILDDLPINRRGFFNGGLNGGRLAFGRDGKLYVSVGEVGERSTAQDSTALNGKVLRVNRDGSLPDDNPFPGLLPYAVGFHDVRGLAFHPSTGRLYAADSGPGGHDELDLVLPGRNYGYPTIPAGLGGAPWFEDPIWDSGDERPGVAGLTFYTGALLPEYRGDLFLCASNTGALTRIRLGGPEYDQVEQAEVVAQHCHLDVAQGPDGALYLADLAAIYRLRP